MLPIDVGDRGRATVGGAIATNAFGARRHRYGSIKDLIVGIEIVRPDGVSARGGGKVVKNVAGFDLPKLMVGSLGTLGVHRERDVPRVPAAGGHRVGVAAARRPTARSRARCWTTARSSRSRSRTTRRWAVSC